MKQLEHNSAFHPERADLRVCFSGQVWLVEDGKRKMLSEWWFTDRNSAQTYARSNAAELAKKLRLPVVDAGQRTCEAHYGQP